MLVGNKGILSLYSTSTIFPYSLLAPSCKGLLVVFLDDEPRALSGFKDAKKELKY